LTWPEFMTDSDVGFPIFRIIAEVVRLSVSNRRQSRHQAASETSRRDVGRLPGQCRADHRQRARPCPRGLVGARSRCALPTAAPPRSWPIYFFFKVPAALLRGLDHVGSATASTVGRPGRSR
jgi:hypothetical protein